MNTHVVPYDFKYIRTKKEQTFWFILITFLA